MDLDRVIFDEADDAVGRLSADQIRRLASTPPRAIALAVRPELDELGADVAERLRSAIHRVCSEMVALG